MSPFLPGQEYVVYQNEPATFTLTIAAAKSPLKAAWLNPLTGQTIARGRLANGKNQLVPPTDWGKTPLVLHVSQ